MKILFILCGMLALSAPLLADDQRNANRAIEPYRQSLRDARVHYQEAVRTHGPRSQEAMNARLRVQQSRRVFHARRRAAAGYR